MNEFAARTPESLIETVRMRENQYEESLREKFLADKLFLDEHLVRAVDNPLIYDELGRLHDDFMQEKRGKNMSERFVLAVSDKYLGKLHVVELGRTSNPGASGEIDGLKDEYRDLLDWMVQHGFAERELTREESGRRVELRKPIVSEAADRIAIMTRNRPLVHTVIKHNNEEVHIAIAKRMVFSIPLITLNALNAGTERKNFKFNDARSLGLIEEMLQHASGGVKPIRTAYYLAAEV